MSGSDLQVPGLVVQGGPGAEEGLGRLRVVVGPAELPPLHRVRGRSQARFHGGNPEFKPAFSYSLNLCVASDRPAAARHCSRHLRDASTPGPAHSCTAGLINK